VNAGRKQVSTGGGRQPFWARNGRELFYRGPDGALMTVGVEHVDKAEGGTGFSWGTPVTVVRGRSYFFYNAGLLGRTYDVSPDGQGFLMIKEGGGADQTVAPTQIVVIQNWVEELKRLVPTN
jgi:hypothetical protein